MIEMKVWISQLLEHQRQNNRPACVTCNQTFAKKIGFKNISQKSTLSSAEIIEANSSKIERKDTSTSMKHVNQLVVNALKKISLNLQITMKTFLLRKKNKS